MRNFTIFAICCLLAVTPALDGASVKEATGSGGISIAVTNSATLANNGQGSSAVVDNSTNLFTEALVTVRVTTNATSGTVATGTLNVYAAPSTDGGSTFGGGEANMCTNSTVTLTSPPNLPLIAVINTPANNTTYQRSGISVASAFNGTLPAYWCIVVENKTGAAISALSANYQGYYMMVAMNFESLQPRLLSVRSGEATA